MSPYGSEDPPMDAGEKTMRPRGGIRMSETVVITSPAELKKSIRIAWVEADAFPIVTFVVNPGPEKT